MVEKKCNLLDTCNLPNQKECDPTILLDQFLSQDKMIHDLKEQLQTMISGNRELILKLDKCSKHLEIVNTTISDTISLCNKQGVLIRQIGHASCQFENTLGSLSSDMELKIEEQERDRSRNYLRIKSLTSSLVLEKQLSASLAQNYEILTRVNASGKTELVRKDSRIEYFTRSLAIEKDKTTTLKRENAMLIKAIALEKTKQKVFRTTHFVVPYSLIAMLLPLASVFVEGFMKYPRVQPLALRCLSLVFALLGAIVTYNSLQLHRSGLIMKFVEAGFCVWDLLFCLAALVSTLLGRHMAASFERSQVFILLIYLGFQISYFVWNKLSARHHAFPEERLPLLG